MWWRAVCGWPLLQLLHEIVADGAEEVEAGLSAVDEVVAVRVDLLAEEFAVLHVGFAHLSAIAEVDIVVGSAVNEKWFDNALVDSANRKVLSIIE